jgi:hypothetical protein
MNKSDKTELVKRGLTEQEAEQFGALLDKVKLSKEDIRAFEEAMEADIPFEGGMSFTEALFGLKESQ